MVELEPLSSLNCCTCVRGTRSPDFNIQCCKWPIELIKLTSFGEAAHIKSSKPQWWLQVKVQKCKKSSKGATLVFIACRKYSMNIGLAISLFLYFKAFFAVSLLDTFTLSICPSDHQKLIGNLILTWQSSPNQDVRGKLQRDKLVLKTIVKE